MKGFKNKLAVTIVVLSVAFLGVIIYSLKSESNSVSGGVGKVVSPLQKIVYSLNNKFKGTIDFFSNFSNVKEENENLKNENAELQNKLVEYGRLKDENTELREVLKFKEAKSNYDYIGVNIIGNSGGNFTEGYIVDRGTDDGIDKDMVVMSPQGLVGKVTRAEKSYAVVQSILNENIAVSTMVESTREVDGILKGTNDTKDKSLTKIQNLPIDSKIKEGDVILTSGLGLVYPKEMRIGQVISVDTDSIKGMKEATVKPFTDFSKLEQLYVVVPKEKVKYN